MAIGPLLLLVSWLVAGMIIGVQVLRAQPVVLRGLEVIVCDLKLVDVLVVVTHSVCVLWSRRRRQLIGEKPNDLAESHGLDIVWINNLQQLLNQI